MALDFEQQFYSEDIQLIVGCDEAGRGCLMGSVYAGAVILPRDFSCDLINDSKKLTAKQREEAFEIIIQNAIAYGIGKCTNKEIDEINILNASRRAIENMNHNFDMVLTDAVKMHGFPKPWEAVIKGDAKALCIAAASILAKVSRDRECEELDKIYPQYGFAKHKGYGTKAHLDAMKKYGVINDIYRITYAPVRNINLEKITLF